MKKILIATPLYPPQIGGPATHVAFFEKHMPSYGYGCVVIPFTRVARYPKIIKHIIYTVLLIRATRGVDMLYALDPVSVGLPVKIVSCITRKPYLLRVPGDYAWEQGQQRFGVTEYLDDFIHNKNQPFIVRLLQWVQVSVARGARHVIVPSRYLKRIVTAWGVAPEHITPIYSVLKEISVPETKEVLRAQYAFDTSFVISTAGRLVPWKGFRALIDVVAILKRDGVPARLMIIGDGVCREELEAYTRECAVMDDVKLYGALPREEMARIIKASDVFVLNTAYEGLSHQLIEVMSLGTPIITTSVGGNPELIDDGVTGSLVAFNDTDALTRALRSCYTAPHTYQRYAESATQSVQKYNEQTIVNEFVTLLKTVWKS